MSKLKRLLVWAAEIVCEIPLLIALLFIIADPRPSVSLVAIRFGLFVTTFLMVGSGYVLTTAIAGVFFRTRTLWVYPATSALLFIFHHQLFTNGWTPPVTNQLRDQAGGASIVFACTCVGTWLLRKWEHE